MGRHMILNDGLIDSLLSRYDQAEPHLQRRIVAELAERAVDAERVEEALHLVKGVVLWAQSAYQWEGFWEDMGWQPKTQCEVNAKKLAAFIRECEEAFPEIAEWRKERRG